MRANGVDHQTGGVFEREAACQRAGPVPNATSAGERQPSSSAWHGGGVAAVIARAGGPAVQRESLRDEGAGRGPNSIFGTLSRNAHPHCLSAHLANSWGRLGRIDGYAVARAVTTSV